MLSTTTRGSHIKPVEFKIEIPAEDTAPTSWELDRKAVSLGVAPLAAVAATCLSLYGSYAAGLGSPIDPSSLVLIIGAVSSVREAFSADQNSEGIHPKEVAVRSFYTGLISTIALQVLAQAASS